MSSIHADPTANTAIARADREIRAREKRRKAAERAARRAAEFRALRSSWTGWTLAWTDTQGRL